MENLEIFFSGNDELTEFEVQQKEYRNDIIVKVGKNLFQPLVITPSRLLSDFNYSISEGEIFKFEPNLILVEKTDKNTIINILVKLNELNYFSELNPVDLKKIYKTCFTELQDLNNWIRVY
jgi:hypothetical protein